MATKKIQIIPPGYTDVCYPQTVASAVIEETDKKFMTDAERTKLTGIATGANNYTHPAYTARTLDNSNGTVIQDITVDASGHVSNAGVVNLDSRYYTETEVDNLLATLNTGLDWKESVATFADLATTYPSPQDGWTVNVKDTDYTYRYTGSAWITISANAIPTVTTSVTGLMSNTDKTKLDGIATGATNTQNHATNGSITVNGTQQVVYAHPTADGDKHVPATGTTNNGKVLKAGATAGSLSWSTLTASEVGAVPTTRTVNGKALSADISITASDVSAYSKTEIDNKNFVYGDPVTTFENFDPINAQFLGGNSPEYYAVKAQVDSAIGQVTIQKNETKTTTFNPDCSITEVTLAGGVTVRTKTTTFPSATQIIETMVENGVTTTKTTTFNPDGTIMEGVV